MAEQLLSFSQLAEQLSVNNVPDLNQEPVTPQPFVFCPDAFNAMKGTEIHFSTRSDAEVVAGSRMLGAQYAASVTTLSRRLLQRVKEVDELKIQISNLQQMLADKSKKNKILKQENKELKKCVDLYAQNLQPRLTELEQEKEQILSNYQQLTAEVQRLRET